MKQDRHFRNEPLTFPPEQSNRKKTPRNIVYLSPRPPKQRTYVLFPVPAQPYPGCQRFLMSSFRFQLVFDPHEKPLERSVIPLRAPSQFQAWLNRLSPDFGQES